MIGTVVNGLLLHKRHLNCSKSRAFRCVSPFLRPQIHAGGTAFQGCVLAFYWEQLGVRCLTPRTLELVSNHLICDYWKGLFTNFATVWYGHQSAVIACEKSTDIEEVEEVVCILSNNIYLNPHFTHSTFQLTVTDCAGTTISCSGRRKHQFDFKKCYLNM